MPGGIHPPLSVIESWPAPHYLDPVTRDSSLVIISVVLAVIAIVTVCARLWARLVIQNCPGLDDWLIVAALVAGVGEAVALCLAAKLYGFDRHVWDVLPATAVRSRKVTMAIESLYVFSTSMTKISILCFCKRMASGSISSGFKWAVRASIAFVIGYTIAFLLVLWFNCNPINAYWDQVDILGWAQTHKYTCINEPVSLIAASAISVSQDFLACGLPMVLFWKLQMPIRQKVILGGIFSIGFFICITGVLRIVYIYKLFYTTYDVTWEAYEVWLWTIVETHLAIVCASAPALKVFLNRYLNVSSVTSGLWSSFRKGTGYYKRKGYAASKDVSGPNSQLSGKHSKFTDSTMGTVQDIEMGNAGRLGGIQVAREVELTVEHRDDDRPFSSHSSMRSSRELHRGKSLASGLNEEPKRSMSAARSQFQEVTLGRQPS